jgi:lipopolysaccharide transport system ATP-binding protein
MARISLKDVNVRMPVYSASTRSIKKTIFSHATGGKIARNARNVPVIEALSDITIDIVSGDRVGLIGANGAGKSTLLRVMAQI